MYAQRIIGTVHAVRLSLRYASLIDHIFVVLLSSSFRSERWANRALKGGHTNGKVGPYLEDVVDFMDKL